MKVRHLLEDWGVLKTDLAARPLYLFLDYDGTLSPIVRDPGQAVLSVRMRRRLEVLLNTGWCRIAVISGRTLMDIRRRIGIPSMTYVGNHGLELEGPDVKFQYPIPEEVGHAFNEVRLRLEKALAAIQGVVLEDKGATLTLHLRKARREGLLMAAHGVSEATCSYRMQGKIVVRPGKEALEIRPHTEWNKGKTILWLLKNCTIAGKEPPWPICVGDDRTDEDAFRVLQGKGLAVFVGAPRKTEATYYLRNVGEVETFLGKLAQVRR